MRHLPRAGDRRRGKTLVSVKLPSTTTPGTPPIQGYLMALTLEQPDGTFVMPDLGASAFPDDLTAPDSLRQPDARHPAGRQRLVQDAGGGGADRGRRARRVRAGRDPVPDRRRRVPGLHRPVHGERRGQPPGRVPRPRQAREHGGPARPAGEDRRNGAGHDRPHEPGAAGCVGLVRRRGDRDACAPATAAPARASSTDRVPDRQRRLAALRRADRARPPSAPTRSRTARPTWRERRDRGSRRPS